MSKVNKYLNRTYDLNAYNCGHFVTEVWFDITGERIDGLCKDFLSTGFEQTRRKRERIYKPKSPCLVVMQRENFPTHVGIFIEGRVLHLVETGAVFQSLDLLPREYKLSYYR